MLRTYTSESVTEGHPDKVCDQISDAVLDAVLERDPDGRVACEAAITTGRALVFGEMTTIAEVDVEAVARRTIAKIGYTSADLGFDAEGASVVVAIDPQSPDIWGGVGTALEKRSGKAVDANDELGAGDQGMMFGYACDETDDLMPLPIWLAHRIARRLTTVRRNGLIPGLRPDGKSQVSVSYEDGVAVGINTILVSAQHERSLCRDDLDAAVKAHVLPEAVPAYLLNNNIDILVNPSGSFVLGGPEADAGLTGRKIIVDTYGGMARHGGGAFSGKDPSKVDRSAAYASRWVAKHVVGSGAARRCELQVAYAIGMARPVSVAVETFGTEEVDPDLIAKAINEVFDLRPSAIIDALRLRRPIYQPLAAYGHMGRTDVEAPWETLDRLDDFRGAVGIGS